jgi:hypothetical protein
MRVATILLQATGAPILSPGEPHYFLCGHPVLAPTGFLKVLDYLTASATARRLAEPDFTPLFGELHLGSGQEAKLLTQPLWDRDLALARDS